MTLLARRRPAPVAGLVAALSALVLSGCQLGLPPSAPTPSATSEGPSASPTSQAPTSQAPTPSAAGTQTPGATPPSSAPTQPAQSSGPSASSPASDTVSRMKGGNGTALPLLVPTSALPEGWKATPARDTRGYRMTVCGVDIEPTAPVDGAQQNWESSTQGQYLEQHVRVYADDTAATVTSALGKKVPGCTTYTAKDAKGQSTFTVEKLALKGAPAGTVAWRQRVDIPVPGSATGTAAPRTVEVVQDVAVRRTGASLVLLNAYGVAQKPDDAALTAALTALG